MNLSSLLFVRCLLCCASYAAGRLKMDGGQERLSIECIKYSPHVLVGGRRLGLHLLWVAPLD